MNDISHTIIVQKAAHLGVDLAGRALGYGLAGFLIAAWLVTTPFMHFGVYLSDLSRKRIPNKR
ncbi:MAG TPA: hypothetical protein VG347_24390 [Verrucomicrobiae bacterium]|nr:hypothetical protein [Verrucomicrobiae bacterium]